MIAVWAAVAGVLALINLFNLSVSVRVINATYGWRKKRAEKEARKELMWLAAAPFWPIAIPLAFAWWVFSTPIKAALLVFGREG